MIVNDILEFYRDICGEVSYFVGSNLKILFYLLKGINFDFQVRYNKGAVA